LQVDGLFLAQPGNSIDLFYLLCDL